MKKTIVLLLLSVCFSLTSIAQSNEEKEVAAAVESLRKAMVDGDKAVLEKITAEELTYGHSGGKIENKVDFVEVFASGKSNFDSISISDQKIQIVGNTAIVRHKLDGVTSDKGKEANAPVHLYILTVWMKKGKDWQLVARQAVKNTSGK